MQKIYKATVTGDRYPTEYTATASNWATAAARTIKKWQQTHGKGSRTNTISIRITKG